MPRTSTKPQLQQSDMLGVQIGQPAMQGKNVFLPPVQSPPKSSSAKKSSVSTKVKNLVTETDDIEIINILIETYKTIKAMEEK